MNSLKILSWTLINPKLTKIQKGMSKSTITGLPKVPTL